MTEESRDWVQWPYVALLALAVGFTAGVHFYGWVGDVTPWGVDGWQFLLGLLVALPVGHYAAVVVLSVFRDEPSAPDARRRAKWVGYLERTIFAAVVATVPGWFSLGGAVAWAGLKLKLNWGPRAKRGDKTERIKAMSALMATAVSLVFAAAGGLII